MLIALISDIHGNWPALEAVFKDINKKNVDAIWCMGDLVGYVPFPNEVIEKIRDKCEHCVIGNYDKKVLAYKKKKAKWLKTKNKSKYKTFKWNHKALSKTSRKYLKSLPTEIEIKLKGKKILLTHGSPDSIEEPLSNETSNERFSELAKYADIIITGHSHQYLNKKVKNCRFVNPGSVGIPPKDDLRARYALLKIEDNIISVKERKVKIDTQRILRAMHAAGFSKELLAFLKK